MEFIQYIVHSPTYALSLNLVKVKVNQSRYRPGVAQRVPGVKVPRFHDNGTGRW